MTFYFLLQNGTLPMYGLFFGLSYLIAGIVLYFLLKNKMSFQYNVLFFLMSGAYIMIGAKELSLILGEGTNFINAGF